MRAFYIFLMVLSAGLQVNSSYAATTKGSFAIRTYNAKLIDSAEFEDKKHQIFFVHDLKIENSSDSSMRIPIEYHSASLKNDGSLYLGPLKVAQIDPNDLRQKIKAKHKEYNKKENRPIPDFVPDLLYPFELLPGTELKFEFKVAHSACQWEGEFSTRGRMNIDVLVDVLDSSRNLIATSTYSKTVRSCQTSETLRAGGANILFAAFVVAPAAVVVETFTPYTLREVVNYVDKISTDPAQLAHDLKDLNDRLTNPQRIVEDHSGVKRR